MTMTISGEVSFSIFLVAILASLEIPALKTRLHKVIAWRTAKNSQSSTDLRTNHGALAESASQSEPAHTPSGYTDSDLEEAVALAIEIERERHECYPREWE